MATIPADSDAVRSDSPLETLGSLQLQTRVSSSALQLGLHHMPLILCYIGVPLVHASDRPRNALTLSRWKILY